MTGIVRHPVGTWRGWSRKKKAAAVGTLAVVGAVGGMAIAAFFATAPIKGSASIIQATTMSWTGTPAVLAKSGGITCTPSIASGELTVGISGARSGDSCDVRGTVKRTGADDVAIQDVSYNPQVTGAFGALDSTGDACGQTFASDGATKVLVFRLTVADGVAAGTYPAEAGAGLHVVKTAEYVDADCPRAS